MKSRFLLLVLCCLFISACGIRIPIDFIARIWKKETSMVLIPAGKFQMGGDIGEVTEKQGYIVYLDEFYIDVYAVTNADYKKFVDANPQWRKGNIPQKYHDGDYLALWDKNDYPKEKADHPVVYVSWYAAMAYAEWTGKRLPTEAEWEKAARGGLIGKKYPWGDSEDTTKAAVQLWESLPRTTAVGTYPPNGYGLYDTAGNVWEWCLDGYDTDSYASSLDHNPIGGETRTKAWMEYFMSVETARVLRGGSLTGDPRMVQVTARNGENPMRTLSLAGFRCVRDAPNKSTEN